MKEDNTRPIMLVIFPPVVTLVERIFSCFIEKIRPAIPIPNPIKGNQLYKTDKTPKINPAIPYLSSLISCDCTFFSVGFFAIDCETIKKHKESSYLNLSILWLSPERQQGILRLARGSSKHDSCSDRRFIFYSTKIF